MQKEKTINDFGPTAVNIWLAAQKTPQNPYRYFGRSLRRSWSYAYFERLWRAGLLRIVSPPDGARGHHWYRAVVD